MPKHKDENLRVKILAELAENPNASCRAIAATCGCSAGMVSNVRRMEPSSAPPQQNISEIFRLAQHG